MKKVITLLVALVISAPAVWSQVYYDVPFPNADLESTTPFELNEQGNEWIGEGFSIWAFPGGDPSIVSSGSGLAPGEGVNGSQAVRVGLDDPAQAPWHVRFQSMPIDIRPSGGGSYIISYSVKADSAIVQDKLDKGHIFWHTFFLQDENFQSLGNEAFGTMLSWDEQFTLHEGFITVTDTLELPATGTGNDDGEEHDVAYATLNIQLAKYAHSYVFDEFSLKGPERFFDITFDVYGIVEGDTSALEGATVVFDGLDFATGVEGLTTVEDLDEGSYEWSVTAPGFESQSGSKEVSQFETVSIYLIEAVTAVDTRNFAGVYPNPASESIQVTSNAANLREIKLLNLAGSVLYRESLNSSTCTMDVSGYPAGVYILEAVNENNQVQNERVVIR